MRPGGKPRIRLTLEERRATRRPRNSGQDTPERKALLAKKRAEKLGLDTPAAIS